ncbi:MAG TPA: CehA/McbA family metallohydrolase [Gemmatimonadaceae bacterium]|nr:CehA/McbA family metallohydrolase [Gemmatimonadaceae bacterium]
MVDRQLQQLRRVAAVALAVMLPATIPAQSAPPATQALKWYKGNTHTHTLNSDGDSSPDDVARWYREHGYHFLVLSDHNFLTDPAALNALFGADEQYLLIPGEEVTDAVGGKPLHINGLAVDRLVKPQGGATIAEALQRDVDAIRAANGLPHLNHPNFGWAVTAADIQRVRNDKLFEIFNGHPLVNNLGGGGMPGLEEMWDVILSSGKLLYGVATDDAHQFKRPGDPSAAGPGRGWVAVRAPRLGVREILEALERGDFYASTGVELTDVQRSPRRVELRIKADSWSRYTTRFIGRDGRVLAESSANPAVYEIRGDEGYVRAVVLESNGKKAWVQPVMLGAAR